MSEAVFQAVSHISPDISHMTTTGTGGTDGQAVLCWTGCRRKSEAAQLPAHLLSPAAGGIGSGRGWQQDKKQAPHSRVLFPTFSTFF